MHGIWKYFPTGLFNSVSFHKGTTPLLFTWRKTNPYYQGITIALVECSCQMPPLSLSPHNENEKKNSTHGTLAASWGSDLCQSLPKGNSPQSVPSGRGIALFLFLSVPRCMVLREICRRGCSCTQSVRDFNSFEDLQGGLAGESCMDVSFSSCSTVSLAWLSCSCSKSKRWLDKKLLGWLRKIVKCTSRLCHLGQIVTILLLGGDRYWT